MVFSTTIGTKTAQQVLKGMVCCPLLPLGLSLSTFFSKTSNGHLCGKLSGWCLRPFRIFSDPNFGSEKVGKQTASKSCVWRNVGGVSPKLEKFCFCVFSRTKKDLFFWFGCKKSGLESRSPTFKTNCKKKWSWLSHLEREILGIRFFPWDFCFSFFPFL